MGAGTMESGDWRVEIEYRVSFLFFLRKQLSSGLGGRSTYCVWHPFRAGLGFSDVVCSWGLLRSRVCRAPEGGQVGRGQCAADGGPPIKYSRSFRNDEQMFSSYYTTDFAYSCRFTVKLVEIGVILMLGEGADLWYTGW